jgi:uncharacterized damage-inducible protein DinB
MNEDLRGFYAQIRGSRERVFGWAEALPPEVYTQEHPDFAYGSLRNIQAHVADCYLAWIGERGLGLAPAALETDRATLTDAAAMRSRFAQVDRVVEQALSDFTDLDTPISIPHRSGTLEGSRRWLLLHPFTHEFHHKGQLLALGRVLGRPYPPGPDTDLPLPSEV